MMKKIVSFFLCFVFAFHELFLAVPAYSGVSELLNQGKQASAMSDADLKKAVQKAEDQVEHLEAVQEMVQATISDSKTVVLPDGTVQYYDRNGRLTKQVSADKKTTLEFTYDDNGGLSTVTKTTEESVTVFDIKNGKAVETTQDGRVKTYSFVKVTHYPDHQTNVFIEGSELLAWNEGKLTFQLVGFLESQTLQDGSVLTYDKQGRLIRFEANDEKKTVFEFGYDASGHMNKIVKTSTDGKIVFDFNDMTAVETLADGQTRVYRFEIRSRNSMMGPHDVYDPNAIALGGWTVPVEGGLRGESIIYSLVGYRMPSDPIPPAYAEYAKKLQQLLGDRFIVTIIKYENDPSGFAIRIMGSYYQLMVLNPPVELGRFEELIIGLTGDDFTDVVLHSANYAGFENVDVRLLFDGLSRLASEGTTPALVLLTQIDLSRIDGGTVYFRLDGENYKVFRDADGNAVIEKVKMNEVIQIFDDQGRVIEEQKNGVTIALYFYGENFKTTVKFEDGRPVSAEKVFDDGRIEYYGDLEIVGVGDANPAEPAPLPDKILLGRKGRPGDFDQELVYGALKAVKFPNGVTLGIATLKNIAAAMNTDVLQINSVYVESLPSPQGLGNAVRAGADVALKDGTNAVLILDGATVGLDENRHIVYDVSAVIKTHLGIQTLVNIVNAFKEFLRVEIEITELDSVKASPLPQIGTVMDLIRAGVKIRLKNGRQFTGILIGTARGVDGNGKTVFKVRKLRISLPKIADDEPILNLPKIA